MFELTLEERTKVLDDLEKVVMRRKPGITLAEEVEGNAGSKILSLSVGSYGRVSVLFAAARPDFVVRHLVRYFAENWPMSHMLVNFEQSGLFSNHDFCRGSLNGYAHIVVDMGGAEISFQDRLRKMVGVIREKGRYCLGDRGSQLYKEDGIWWAHDWNDTGDRDEINTDEEMGEVITEAVGYVDILLTLRGDEDDFARRILEVES